MKEGRGMRRYFYAEAEMCHVAFRGVMQVFTLLMIEIRRYCRRRVRRKNEAENEEL